jgi:hypothetical protein
VYILVSFALVVTFWKVPRLLVTHRTFFSSTDVNGLDPVSPAEIYSPPVMGIIVSFAGASARI